MKKIILSVLLTGWLGLSMAQSIQKAEYFIDTDPGYGAGVNLTFTPSDSVVIPLNIPLPIGLSIGFHKFSVRAKDANNRWNMVYSQDFFKTSSETVSNDDVVALEYFIDTDPGYGQAIQIPFSTGSQETVDLAIPIPISLPLGFHKFHIRAKDFFGRWSVVYSQNFFKSDELGTVSNIVKLEYFFDVDPGFGQATPMNFSPSTDIDLSNTLFSLGSGSLGGGEHTLYVRALDALGKWSIVGSDKFIECPGGITISATPSAASCGDSITLNTTVQNLGHNYTWNWRKDGGSIGFNNATSIKVGESGLYSVFITDNDTTGSCATKTSSFLQINILKSESLTISSSSAQASCDESATLKLNEFASIFSTETGITYSWLRNGSPLSNSDCSAFKIIQGGNYQLKLTHKGALSGCAPLFSNSINILDKIPVVQIQPFNPLTGKIVVCNGANLELKAETNLKGNLTYKWFKNNVQISNATADFLSVSNAAGTYQLKIKSGVCPEKSSENMPLVYETGNVGTLIINLVNGSLSSCPGSIAQLAVTGCSGETLWNTFQTSSTIDVTQLNQPFTYKAVCKSSCLAQVNGSLTFTPLAPVYSAPVINVAPMPFDTAIYITEKLKNLNEMPGFGLSYRFIQMDGGRFFYYGAHVANTVVGSRILNIGSASPSIDGILANSNNFIFGLTTTAGTTADKSAASFGGSDFWIFEMDLLGNILREKSFGGSGNEDFKRIIKLPNGHYALCGSTNSTVSGNMTVGTKGGKDYLVVCIDSLGNKVWEKTYGGSADETLETAFLARNGQLLLGGNSKSGISFDKSEANQGEWLVVLNPLNGQIVTEKSYGFFSFNTIADITQNTNGDVFILRNWASSSASKINVIKLNESYALVHSFETNSKYPIGQGGLPITCSAKRILCTVDNNLLIFYEQLARANNGIEDGDPHDFSEAKMLGSLEVNEFGTYQSGSATYNGFCGPNTFQDIQFDRFGDVLVSFFGSGSTEVGGLYNPPNNNIFCGTCDIASTFRECEVDNIFPSSNDYLAHVFRLKRIPFQESNFLNFCKPRDFVLNASIPFSDLTDSLRNIEFLWSDGGTGATRSYTAEDSQPLHVSYKVKNKPTCGSLVKSVELIPFKNQTYLTGNNGGLAFSTFAYKELTSKQIPVGNTQYTSEGSIVLIPGFKAQAANGQTFKANIDVCQNQ